MKRTNKWFTLIELTLSILILSIIVWGISVSLMKVSQNFATMNKKIFIYNDVQDFLLDTAFVDFNSWHILSGGILLYWENGGVIIWDFLDVNNGGYQLHYNDEKYQKSSLWYFLVGSWVLNNLIWWNLDYNPIFKRWKIYPKIPLKNTSFSQSWTLFDINLEIFLDESLFIWKNKSNTFVPQDDFIKINLKF